MAFAHHEQDCNHAPNLMPEKGKTCDGELTHLLALISRAIAGAVTMAGSVSGRPGKTWPSAHASLETLQASSGQPQRR